MFLKGRSKLFYAGVIVLAIILLLALLFLGAWFLFEIKEVKVEGNEFYSNELIEEQILDDEYSWNALYVFLKYKVQKADEIPFIDTMTVHLENRNTVVIKVYEKEMIGYTYVSTTGQYAYLDKDGIVVERSTNCMEGVSCIEGLDVTEVTLYEKLQVKDNSIFKELLSLTNSLKKYDLLPEIITVQELGSFRLTYGDVFVNFGQAEDINEKVVRLQKIMPSLEGKSGILHLENWEGKDSDITFEITQP